MGHYTGQSLYTRLLWSHIYDSIVRIYQEASVDSVFDVVLRNDCCHCVPVSSC